MRGLLAKESLRVNSIKTFLWSIGNNSLTPESEVMKIHNSLTFESEGIKELIQ
jgi:hypothetical protein